MVLRSPDGVVSVAVTADRTDEAVEAPPGEIARGAVTSLPGLTGAHAGEALPFKAFYPGVEALGTGTRTSDNLKQSFRSFVLVKDEAAAFTALATQNAKAKSPFAGQVEAIVRSIRGRPVSVPG
jgi:hypothetical protein